MNPLKWFWEVLKTPTRLKNEYKRKISEAHLKIRTGDCTPAQLDQATETLRNIQAKKLKIL